MHTVMLYCGNIMENKMEQRSREWHKARVGRITGSRAGAILGNSPYQTSSDAMRAMVRECHNAPSEFVGGPHIDWGVNNEDDAIWQFELEHGKNVEKCGFFPYDDYLGASPDGLIDDDAILEVKCPYSRRKGGEFKSVEEQPHYYDQMQLEMLCSGRNKAYFYQWSPHNSNLEIVNLDEEWLSKNVSYLKQQHAFYLSELDNPEHIEPMRKDLTGNNRATMIVEEVSHLREAKDNAEQKIKELLAELVDASKGRDAVIGRSKLTKVEKKGSVSYAKAIKELVPDADLTKWTGKSSFYWKLT